MILVMIILTTVRIYLAHTCVCCCPDLTHRAGTCSGDALELYAEGTLFESRFTILIKAVHDFPLSF
jgi:hypothetical protein